MKKKLFLFGLFLFGIASFAQAAFHIEMGGAELQVGGYYTFPGLTVTADLPTESGYVVRFMFTRAVNTTYDIITLAGIPSGWTQPANSTAQVRMVSGAAKTAAELQTFLRQVQVKFDPAKKGQEVMVLISDLASDAGRNIYYSSDTQHYYEFISQGSILTG
ncbi:MAG: hypothetical protein LBT83_10100 [Tannerella sp.]|nr:hypothetical protein [Tannerella sp.]